MKQSASLKHSLTAVIEHLDDAVFDMVSGCEFDGRSWCDWTNRMHHHYVELRQAWQEAGGTEDDLSRPLRLTEQGHIRFHRRA